jgi:hypothetical protein
MLLTLFLSLACFWLALPLIRPIFLLTLWILTRRTLWISIAVVISISILVAVAYNQQAAALQAHAIVRLHNEGLNVYFVEYQPDLRSCSYKEESILTQTPEKAIQYVKDTYGATNIHNVSVRTAPESFAVEALLALEKKKAI